MDRNAGIQELGIQSFEVVSRDQVIALLERDDETGRSSDPMPNESVNWEFTKIQECCE